MSYLYLLVQRRIRIVMALLFASVAPTLSATAGENLSGRSLAFSNFSGRDLRGANLSNADLSMTNFSGADLRGADLTGANLDGVNFDDADLRGVVGWAKANLGQKLSAMRANFGGTDLRNAKVVGGYSGGYFEGADFSGADLTGATLDGRFHGAKFDEATVHGALMIGAVGIEPQHDDLRRRGAIVSGGDLAAAAKSGRDFSGSNLTVAPLQDVDLTGVKLVGVNLHSANLSRTKLNDVNLKMAELYFAEANEAHFDRADLSQAHLDNCRAAGATFDGAKLVRASLAGADLTGASLRNADLTGADLSRADLTGADLTGAILDGVSVDGAIIKNIRGLDAAVLRDLRQRAARWKHDLANGFEWFISNWSLPLHLTFAAIGTLLGINGMRRKLARVSFGALTGINVAATIPFWGGLIFAMQGWSPTAQMSEPGLWSAWFRLHALMAIGLFSLFAVCVVVSAFHVIKHVIMSREKGKALSLLCALLTLANCFFAIGTLALMAPDA